MITKISTVTYGYEQQENGKYKLYIKHNDEDWRQISSQHRRNFQNAVNEFTDIQPDGVDLMNVWEQLDYDLPETPWDWMQDGD